MPPHSSQKKETALAIGVVSTFIALLPTSYAAIVSNSVILYADLFRCLVEFGTILLAYVILRRVTQGDGSRFNYGYGKLEQISSIAVAIAMFVTFLAVVFSSVLRIIHPQLVRNGEFGFVLNLLSILGNLSLWLYYKTLARGSNSTILNSQSQLFRAKTFASSIVALSLFPSILNSKIDIALYADPLGSLILSGILLHSAVGLFYSSMHELLDCSLEEALQLRILKMLIQFDTEYRGLKQIRTRRSGSQVFVELSLEFESDLKLEEVQKRINKMQTQLREMIPGGEFTIIPSASILSSR